VIKQNPKKSEILRHQNLSNVRASCKISAKNNIGGALTKKNNITAQTVHKTLNIDFIFLVRASRMLFFAEILQAARTFDIV